MNTKINNNASIFFNVLVAILLLSLIVFGLFLYSLKTQFVHPLITSPSSERVNGENIHRAKEAFSIQASQQNQEMVTAKLASCQYCEHTIHTLLSVDNALSDENLIDLSASINELALLIQSNPTLIEQLIEKAISTEDGNTRELIIAVLSEINPKYTKKIALELSSSLNAIQRQQGVNLLTILLADDVSIVNELTNNLLVEDDANVKKAMINSLSREDLFYNDDAVISSLRELALVDPSAEVRGKALLGVAKLMVEPEMIFQETIEAIHSKEDKLSFYALEALDHMLVKMTREERATTAYEQTIRNLVDTFMSEEYNTIDSSLRLKLDSIYQRFL